MLTETDRNYMVEVLATELGGSGTPRQDLVTPFYNTDFGQALIDGGNARTLAIDAIRLCDQDAWNHHPSWLELIIETFDLANLYPKVTEILERTRLSQVVVSNPLNNFVLINGSPFVNRTIFRNKVNRLNNSAANTQPILVVSGDPQSGKSYSHAFIDHFTNHYASIFVYKYEFDNEMGLEIGPERVAVDLVAKMGKSKEKMPPPETNLKLYIRQLALWVLNEASQTLAQHWFVLDNFTGEKLRPETRDFIIALTDNVTTGVFQKRCRIVLIGFDSTSLTINQAQYDEEFIGHCTPADIQKALTEILNYWPALDFATYYAYTVDNLPAAPAKMSELNARMSALMFAIKSLKEILANVAGVKFEDILLQMLKDLPPGKEKLKTLKKRLQLLLQSTN